MIRAFLAVPLPQELRDGLTRLTAGLKRLELDVRFPRPESIHLTLKFLGDINTQQVGEIKHALAGLSRLASFSVTVEKLGVFPHLGNPRVVWAGVASEQQLSKLHEEIEKELKELGFEQEKRNFSPHLTLARVKSRRNIGALSHFVQENGAGVRVGILPVEEVCLYQSILRPEGARYEVLSRFELRGL